MNYYKQIQNGNIDAIGIGAFGTPITEEEYMAIKQVLANRPEDTDTTGYYLTEELEWVSYDITPIEDLPITDSEAVEILLGEDGDVNG